MNFRLPILALLLPLLLGVGGRSSKIFSRSADRLPVAVERPGIVGGWEMDLDAAGDVIDKTPNNNDGTIFGALAGRRGVLGDSLRFDGVDDYLDISGIVADVAADQAGSVIIVFEREQNGALDLLWSHSDPATVLHNINFSISTANLLSTQYRNANPFGADNCRLVGDDEARAGQVHVAALITDGSTTRLYLNGRLQIATVSGINLGKWIGDLDAGAYDQRIGRLQVSTGSFWFGGRVYLAEVYSRALTAGEIASYSARLRRVYEFSTTGNAPLSAGQVTAGVVEGTPFAVVAGGAAVVADAIAGATVKALSCITTDCTLYFPAGLYAEHNNAYGSWEFSSKLQENDWQNVAFISSTRSGNNDGYRLANEAGVIKLSRLDASVVTDLMESAPGLAPAGEWHLFKITRDRAGTFAVYVDGARLVPAVGANPAVDNTYTEAEYFKWISSSADGRLSLGSGDGRYAIRKGIVP